MCNGLEEGVVEEKVGIGDMVWCAILQRFAASTATIENVAGNRPVAYWIFGTAAMVGGMIAVGGATRLTRSGLSMVQWKPQGSLPPMTPQEWEEQFEIYKQFPEYQQRKNMVGCRGSGTELLCRLVDGAQWFGGARQGAAEEEKRSARQPLPSCHTRKFNLIGIVGISVGLELTDTALVQFCVCQQLAFAFTTLGVLLWTGFNLVAPPSRAAMTREMISPDVLKKVTRIRKILGHVSTALGYTIISGAFVAGIDAGMAFNTFPKMDEQWIPDDLFVLEPKYKNFFENVPLVQLDHRVLALSTLAGFGGVYGMARRPQIWNQLPQQSRNALNMALAAAGGQVLLGITTLLNCVPIPLAVSHQCGAIVLMTATLWSQHTLNFAKPLKKAAQAAIKAAPKTL
ncbi:unnamed protein product [Phytophthora lilii]|uniref:Unnamed protein product n=1 Tax=Phytophthora lilii TaxID=2077276 RepID=A0A9W6YD75_9STRA|nr:unnamed protein product [Phytophthora lilii]